MLSRILYEDEEILVAHKPAGIAVQTARVGQADVVSELRNYLCQSGGGRTPAGRQEPYLGIVHRLDQPVEGLLVFAKTRHSAASLTGQLQKQGDEGSFCKQYYAVLCGIPAAREGRLADYLYKEGIKNGKHIEYKAVIKDADSAGQRGSGTPVCSTSCSYSGKRDCSEALPVRQQIPPDMPESAGARLAVLDYRILQTQEEKGLALADIRIETGRFHQIRVQMAHGGTPLLGDLKYGNEETKALAQALGIRNVALCAYRLGFVHPVSKKEMDFRIKPENPAFSSFSQL